MSDTRKKNSKKRRAKKSGLFTNCCCASGEKSDDLQYYSNKNTKISLPAARYEIFKTDSTPYLPSENICSQNALLSQAYADKLAKTTDTSKTDKEVLMALKDPTNIKDRDKQDELVRTILAKYLATKREEAKKLNPNSETASFQNQNSGFINIECGSSDVLVLKDDNESDQNLKPYVPAVKSRSAPTNCVAQDSLLEICSKMKNFQPEDSTSRISCSSKKSLTAKKKLELIFNHSTQVFEENTALVQYAINCNETPLATGTLKITENGLLQENEETQDKFTLQELYLNPSIKKEDGSNGSTSSLKWKLIISHRGRGDCR